MNSFSINSLRISLIGITALFILVCSLFPTSVSSWDYGVFVVLIVITGIPHGATDHLIFFHLRKEANTNLFIKFVLVYLFVMAVYGSLWIFLPLVSLLFFLIMSAYHFGQSQFTDIQLPENHFYKRITYIIWGSWLLVSILLLNAKETVLVLQALFPEVEAYINTMMPYTVEILGGLSFVLFFTLLIGLLKKWLALKDFTREIVTGGILMLLFTQASLWISFGVYFGLWHALSSIYFEVKGLNKIDFIGFFKKAIPFSLISFVGIGLLLLIGIVWEGQVSLTLLFFIALSTLTLPHTLYMQRFYSNLNT